MFFLVANDVVASDIVVGILVLVADSDSDDRGTGATAVKAETETTQFDDVVVKSDIDTATTAATAVPIKRRRRMVELLLYDVGLLFSLPQSYVVADVAVAVAVDIAVLSEEPTRNCNNDCII